MRTSLACNELHDSPSRNSVGGGSVEHAGKARARSAGLTFCGRATARPATVASPSYSTKPPVVVSVATAVAVAGTRDTEGGRAQGPGSRSTLSSTAQVWLAGVEPAISSARSRWGGRLPYSQMNVDQAPPAGLEPAASGLRARRQPFRPRGQESSGGRARTCLSRLTVARLTDSTTPERKTDAADSNPRTAHSRLRASNTLPCQLGHASTRRKERESNPQGPRAHPFSRRDTTPVAVLPKVAPAGVEPATFRLKGGSSAS
jgi:hypothetical protein